MRDFQEFINEKIIIVPETKEEMESILKMCENHGIKWKGTNKKPTDYNFKFGVSKLGIEHGLLAEGWLFEKGREFVMALEFLQPQTTIEIFQSKQTVVCLKKQDGKVIARGVARCSKDDEFNFDYGAELAFNRMLGNLKKDEQIKPKQIKIKTLKDGTKIIKQDSYEVGDNVLLKKNIIDMFLNRGISVEKIVKIEQFYKDDCCKNGIRCNSGYPRGVSNSDIKGKVIE